MPINRLRFISYHILYPIIQFPINWNLSILMCGALPDQLFMVKKIM
jgi:hypothetical protein